MGGGVTITVSNEIEPKLPRGTLGVVSVSLPTDSGQRTCTAQPQGILRKWQPVESLQISVPPSLDNPATEGRVQTWGEGPNLAALLFAETICGETNTIPLRPAAPERCHFLACENRDLTSKSFNRKVPASCPSYSWPMWQRQSVCHCLRDTNSWCQIMRQKRFQTKEQREHILFRKETKLSGQKIWISWGRINERHKREIQLKYNEGGKHNENF